jgi:hypothetical protein
LMPALVVFLLLSWRHRYWNLANRLHYTAVVAAAILMVPFLYHWNLLGFWY